MVDSTEYVMFDVIPGNTNILLVKSTAVGIEQHLFDGPRSARLLQNYPNPFNPVTVISYQLPVVSDIALKIYDVLGREVSTLVNERQTAGNHNVTFNARDLPSGVYFYSILAKGGGQAGTYNEVKKLVLLK